MEVFSHYERDFHMHMDASDHDLCAVFRAIKQYLQMQFTEDELPLIQHFNETGSNEFCEHCSLLSYKSRMVHQGYRSQQDREIQDKQHFDSSVEHPTAVTVLPNDYCDYWAYVKFNVDFIRQPLTWAESIMIWLAPAAECGNPFLGRLPSRICGLGGPVHRYRLPRTISHFFGGTSARWFFARDKR
ncbi:LOW QUALITY PROTEIN: Cleavage induced protein [Phytophthora megakarya]|uniref:Cleavage induced protein n=1 Tax=Phytophthora megakarya TaxID=4795 RepID=A0A225VGZ8_9STRA|nr:LOW QUALITY PROTEIN: Cleavage induced protein [Phytophthora megakarya]